MDGCRGWCDLVGPKPVQFGLTSQLELGDILLELRCVVYHQLGDYFRRLVVRGGKVTALLFQGLGQCSIVCEASVSHPSGTPGEVILYFVYQFPGWLHNVECLRNDQSLGDEILVRTSS